MAVRPPPMTTIGSRTVRLARLDVLAAPVSCSAIRKSDAWRTPRARPFFIDTTVGRPAPAQSAIWSKPIAKASSMVIVPPKRTPPYIANCARRSISRRMTLRKFLSHRTVMPYSATPPKPAIARSSRFSQSSAFTSRIGRVPARQQRIDLEAPGQRQHVFQRARLDLRNVDWVLLLIDAGLHAIVADAMPGA